ncbi:isoleucine--tRNA ligase, mitochondrial [Diprion similis]|uniref:isoleucine--tRNA ligase, mitochondrial n=1 Tax=Diprion similis TaxID=362088 RepID=UPI001EF7C4ED|nr:isoleucine--tRNA ligase, mitochondrial [Diprion similis]
MSAGLGVILGQTKNILSYNTKSLLLRYVQTSENVNAKKYTASILLPQTKFPSRINGKKRVEMDKYLLEKCGFSELYSWQRSNLCEPDFVLHDGPPYANGNLHMGHAINKILKDITIRSKIIRGQRVHFVPGWDCHGLPIEMKALISLKENERKLTPVEIRQKAQKYANETILKQRDVFMSWGIMADWKESGCYFTHHTSYVTNQLRQFITLYEKDLVNRDFKPVYWSPSSRTALAESELEYNAQHISKTATIRLLLDVLPPALESLKGRPVYALTWTTTPWTLVANQAIAFAEDVKYCAAEDSEMNFYIVAENLLNEIQEKIGVLKPLITITGTELRGGRYVQPLTGLSSPFVPGSHVTTEKGTGLVHIAPGHGMDDFLIGLANKLPVLSFVDENGCYTADAGSDFVGLHVLNEGGKAILNKIQSNVVHTENYQHSYPYDWRTKTPVIVRASKQWFIKTNALKQQALDSLQNVSVYPASNSTSSINGLTQQVKMRPYWCISRQRVWGTPIPVLYYRDSGDIITNRDWIERLCHLMGKYGLDCWWELPIEKLAGKKLLRELEVDASELERGQDILDIWFDSGISWSTVLPDGKADLYLEGIDQFTGWFQSSLLTSIALQGAAPYKSLFAHGFAVDDKGHKMSKSLGNVIDPEEVTQGGEDLKKKPAYGVDTLRWWVASHGTQHTLVPVTEKLLKGSAESVQKLRLIFRFLLGALHPYPCDTPIEPEYHYLDKYLLHQLYHYDKRIETLYSNYEYHNACKVITHFVANTVSALYCHLVKDRLYCNSINSSHRAGAVDIISEILAVLTRSLAPILPHLAEEVWLHHPDNLASVPLFHSAHKLPTDWDQPSIAKMIESALNIKAAVTRLATINTWELAATITLNPAEYSVIRALQKDESSETSQLCELFQLSAITLTEKDGIQDAVIDLKPIRKSLCARCYRYPEPQPGKLCARCDDILSHLST